MKELKYSTIFLSILILMGCGGSNDSTNDINPIVPNKPKPPGDVELICDRGVLLNSILASSSTSIFDKSLFQFSTGFDYENSDFSIYSIGLKRDGQMLYGTYYGVSQDSIDDLEQEEASGTDQLVLNTSGVYGKQYYQKQNKGWPMGYIINTQGLNIKTSSFDDQCHFKSSPFEFEYETVDVSGRKISEIMPQGAIDNTAKKKDYLYLSPDLIYVLKRNNMAFNQLYQSTAVFPQGSVIYVPKKVVLDDTQFYFGQSDLTDYRSLDEWIETYPTDFKYAKDTVSGIQVAYPVNEKGNQIYDIGTLAAIEKDGIIYDAEWQIKGNLISTDYGAQGNNSEDNYYSKGEHAYLNQASYQFILQQYQQYYK